MRTATAANADTRRPLRPHRRSVTDRLGERMSRATVFGRRLGDIRAALTRRPVPQHWTNLFGVVTVACIVVLTVTGILLMFWYTPSSATTTYDGAYAPLRGAEVSHAFASTMRITFEIPGGLLVRQAHHWAGLLLPAAIIMQLLTTFFTGAFRKPRRGMWVLLFLIFVAALAGGWSGYALPDDLLSGTGLRITEGIALGIPVVGTWLASLLFGGSFPGEVIAHLYPLHVAIAPAALVALVALRALAAWRVGPVQWPGAAGGRGSADPGLARRTDDPHASKGGRKVSPEYLSPTSAGGTVTRNRIVGVPLWPNAAARAGGLVALVTGVIIVISATVTVNPIWLYGPADPGSAGAGSQPDWYTGFLDGALRLVPSGWEIVLFDRTWTLAVLAPLAVVTAFLVAILVYPFLEAWATGDHREHHLLERPRTTPTRTGIGVAAIVFYGTLWAAGSADLIATQFSLTFEGVIAALQATLVLGPIIGFAIARRACLGLQRRDRDALRHGYETGRIVRLPGGEYVEVHAPLGAAARARIERPEPPVLLVLRPDERGRLTLARRVQFRLSRWYLADSIDSETGARMVPVGGGARRP
ncbi:menaquinol-cytochrome c reductase cytochrome b subunit [Agromyces luteolus]|uniref:Cytochrome bc1 complex cytochrome b subunit n=1 Tax=Agromyces luteolus TaxID=88373 RepID=A0A7C9MIS8_9MICO|nr:cytochrome b N-terminal domain-containing protein [Agromyces luteolus]MUN08158.1 ubiquinol-cytochrome c reductase cytochrome b subunit [Agromyces luteolus]GLK29624.1 menaquinol-cytochrome c reductase cytochrome b subunit [Agromyces luteolus]